MNAAMATGRTSRRNRLFITSCVLDAAMSANFLFDCNGRHLPIDAGI
jgi:hypothetical protein